MKFDRPGIIGYHLGRLETDSFTRITNVRYSNPGYSNPGYYVSFRKPDGRCDFWRLSTNSGDFIEIDGIRYEGDRLETFCNAFITMTETNKAIDSLQ